MTLSWITMSIGPVVSSLYLLASEAWFIVRPKQWARCRYDSSVTVLAHSFEFLDTTKLNVRDEQNSDGDDAECHDVLPEVPRCLVCNALLCQVRGTVETARQQTKLDAGQSPTLARLAVLLSLTAILTPSTESHRKSVLWIKPTKIDGSKITSNRSSRALSVGNGRASDLRSRGREFEPRPGRGCVTTLGKLFTPMCPSHQQFNLVAA